MDSKLIIKQSGFTMVELIFVLALASSIILLTFSQFNYRESDAKTHGLIQDHKSLVATILSIGNGRDNYFIDWANTLKSSNALPGGMYADSSGNIKHALNGNVRITPLEYRGPSSGDTRPGIPIISISYSNLGPYPCLRLAASIATSSYETKINGRLVKLSNPPNLDMVNIASISGLCSDNNIVEIQNTQNLDFINYNRNGGVISPEQAILYPKRDSLIAERIRRHR